MVLTLFTASFALAENEPDDTSTYKITIPQDDHQIAIVTATLRPIEKTFYMFRGANQLPKRWSTFVSNFRIIGEDNQPIPFSAMEDGSWQLSTLPAQPAHWRPTPTE